MSVSEIEQKTADRYHDLFHSSWARGADFATTLLISIWLYVTVWEKLRSPGDMPGPLSWWRVQLAQAGIHYPRWLDTVTDWHAPHDGSVLLLALTVGAVGAATGWCRLSAPGFSILALLALSLSTQWFGIERAMEVYGMLIALLLIAAIGMAGRSWLKDRRRTSVERSGMFFSLTTIEQGLMNGPVGILLLPFICPIILLWKAVRTLGYDRDQHGSSRAVDLLQRELRDLEQSATLVSDLSAADAARLLVIVQALATSPVMSRQALDLLNFPLPPGAVRIPEKMVRLSDTEVRLCRRPFLLGRHVSRVKETHPYEVPGISTRPIVGGNPDYLQWITKETS